jgi:hypothetical protein
MAETAAQRFARDTAYKTVDPSDPRWEDGSAKFARDYVSKDPTMTVREYEDGAGTSALKTYIDGL